MRGVQFPILNRYEGLPQAISSGIQLGSMYRKSRETKQPSDAILTGPGPRPMVTPEQVLGDVSRDVTIIEEYEKKLKNMTPEQKRQSLKSLADSGQIQSDFAKAILKYSDIKPQEMRSLLNDYANNPQKAEQELDNIYIPRAGGKGGKLDRAATQLGQRAKALQSEYNNIYAQKLRSVLEKIDEVVKDPRKWQGKSGIMNPVTAETVGNWQNYVEEYVRIDPQGAKNFLEEMRNKRGGQGFKPENWKGKVRKKDGTVETVYGSGVAVETFQSKHPGVYDIQPLRKKSMFEEFIDESRPGKELTQGIVNKYKAKYKTEEATKEALRRDGYKVN